MPAHLRSFLADYDRCVFTLASCENASVRYPPTALVRLLRSDSRSNLLIRDIGTNYHRSTMLPIPRPPFLYLSPQQPIYNTFFKRNSVFVTSVFLGSFVFSLGFDLATSSWWDAHNRGVSSSLSWIHQQSESPSRAVLRRDPSRGVQSRFLVAAESGC
jgi:ubiquinol-cytochrome c reductase subunit 9